MKLKIAVKLFLTILLISILPMLVLGGISFFYTAGEIDETAEDLASWAIKDVQGILNTELDRSFMALGLLEKVIENEGVTGIGEYLRFIQEDQRLIRHVYLGAEADGAMTIYPPADLADDYDARTRDWYRGGRGGVYGSPVYKDALTGTLLVTLSRGVRRGSDFLGVVGMDLDLEVLREFLKTESSDIGRAYLIDKKGAVILGDHEDATGQAYPLFENLDISQERGGCFQKIGGEPHYVYQGAIPSTQWHIVKELPLRELLGEMSIIRRLILAMLILSVISSAGTVMMVNRLLLKPIKKTAGALKDIADGRGDLTVRLESTRKDEIGVLTESFNAFNGTLREDMCQIKERMEAGLEVSRRLKQEAAASAVSTKQIASSSDSIRRETQDLAGMMEESSSAVEEITANIRSMNGEIGRQGQAIQETSASVTEMLASIEAISRNAQGKKDLMARLEVSTRNGREELSQADSNMQRMGKSLEAVLEVIDVIDGIASTTNILSMNAAIEAAHAGEAGRGFAVVAEEIRKLADSVAENARDISQKLQENRELMAELERSSSNTLELYEELEESSGLMIRTFDEIREGTVEQAAGAEEIMRSVHLLEEVSREVGAGFGEILTGAELINRSVLQMKETSEEIREAAEEIAVGTNQINGGILNINSSAEENRTNLEEVAEVVNSFKTEEDA